MTARIAIVLDSWDYSHNGTVVSTQRFIDALGDEEYEFVILAMGPATPQKISFPMLRFPGITWLTEKMKAPLALPHKRRLREALKDVDLLHVQYPLFLGAGAISVAQELGIPVISSFHLQSENILRNLYLNFEWLNRLLYRLFIRAIYRHSDLIICPTRFAESILHQFNVQRPTQVISNGVPSSFLKSPQETKFLPKAPEQRFKLLSVGRLSPEKHQHLIVEAIAQSAFQDRIEVFFVGVGPTENRLRKLAAEKLSCPFTVSEVSAEKLMQLYAEADLFVHAGEVELEGMSVLEAMAQSLPVIVANSERSAAKHLVVDENSLFEFPNIESLTEKIDFWLENPLARRHAANQNHARALEHSHDASTEMLNRMYRQQLKLTEPPSVNKVEPLSSGEATKTSE